MHTWQACDNAAIGLTELRALLADDVPPLPTTILSRKNHPCVTTVRDPNDGVKQLLLAELCGHC